MTVSADFSDIGRLNTLLGGASNRLTSDMPGVLDDVAESVADQARANAPVDSGELRADIGVKRRQGTKTTRARWVGTDEPQGFFQEFGTADHGPQPWLTPAADAGVETLVDRLGELGDPFR